MGDTLHVESWEVFFRPVVSEVRVHAGRVIEVGGIAQEVEDGDAATIPLLETANVESRDHLAFARCDCRGELVAQIDGESLDRTRAAETVDPLAQPFVHGTPLHLGEAEVADDTARGCDSKSLHALHLGLRAKSPRPPAWLCASRDLAIGGKDNAAARVEGDEERHERIVR